MLYSTIQRNWQYIFFVYDPHTKIDPPMSNPLPLRPGSIHANELLSATPQIRLLLSVVLQLLILLPPR